MHSAASQLERAFRRISFLCAAKLPFSVAVCRRFGLLAVAASSMAVTLSGCTTFLARQAIERFASGLEQQSLEQLKENASPGFEEKALRLPEAAKDLRILRLPKGKISVVSDEKLDEKTRKVVVEIGEKSSARQVEYILKQEGQIGHWVIDDIILTQESGGGQEVSRTVTEQMDLLLTCRELLGAWREGTREQKLQFCTPELKGKLSKLPATWLDQLTVHVAGNGRDRAFRPEARMNGERAVLALDHPDGNLILDFQQVPEGWQLNDAALEPSGKSTQDRAIRSLQKFSQSLQLTASFLQAYAAQDRGSLKQCSSKGFFEKCLAGADLSDVPIPAELLEEKAYEVRQFKDRTEVLLGDGAITYMVTLTLPEESPGETVSPERGQRISEVTLFEESGEVKRISAMFLAHAVVDLYAEALASRDLKRIRELSSIDFNRRVWDHPSAKLLTIVPIPEVDVADLSVVSTTFRGDVTEVTVTQGGRALAYVLQQAGAWMVVDDVLVPAFARPTSLKTNLELMLPVYAFASAAHTSSLPGLIDTSAESLDRIVWKQIAEVPALAPQVANALVQPINSVQPGDPWSVVRTGDGSSGAEVRLVREGDRYVVATLALINGPEPGDRVELLKTLRDQIADGTLRPRRLGPQRPVMATNGFGIGSGTSDVQQAGYEAPAQPAGEPSPIQQTGFEAAGEAN